MAFITSDMVIAQLGLRSTSGLVTQINSIIPGAIQKAFDVTRNYCHVKGQFVKSYFISFSSSEKKIILSGGGFQTNGYNPIRFQAGMYFHIKGSVLNNNKIVKSLTVTNTEIVLEPSETLFDEDAGSFVSIYMMDMDEGFKSAIIDYIGYKLKTAHSKGINSEKFDDYSVSFKDEADVISAIFKGHKNIVSSE